METSAIKILSFDRSDSRSELIGHSRAIREVWQSIQLVAPTDAVVLILGETGTGKELVAKAIHEESSRSRGPYVKVNCAAMPSGLLESEIFGHERGAFTGAVAATIGRFQLADTGTLFLDEIGDLPLELQPKLPRVLQEQEFEKLGSTRTVRVDVRIVAATNMNLNQMVRDRRFRADLFYRLNVFPIVLPPLRSRRDDIPLLARHFVQKFAGRMKKEVCHIPDDSLDILCKYNWPGNVRELQNVIERAVIMSSGPNLRLSSLAPGVPVDGGVVMPIRPLEEAERELIVNVLRQVHGVVGGPAGAAARLGMPRTTLLYRMRKLKIIPEKKDATGVYTADLHSE